MQTQSHMDVYDKNVWKITTKKRLMKNQATLKVRSNGLCVLICRYAFVDFLIVAQLTCIH